MFASAFILLCYAVLERKHHYRHALIVNLAVSGQLAPPGDSI
jgi:hypothetical protein